MITTYNYNNATNFLYTPARIDWTAALAKLLLNTGTVVYTETFDNDSGHTYDNTKVEYIAGVARQKDQRPANATCGAIYNSHINLNWGNGTLTGTAYGGAAIVGGALDLTKGSPATQKYITYSAIGNANSQQTLCVRFTYIPAYSGSPTDGQFPFSIGANLTDDSNSASIFHSSAGQLTLRVCDSIGNYIIPNVALGAWSPVAGTEYRFEFNMDITTGATRLFINGTQFGITATQTGTRTADINYLRIGNLGVASTRMADFKIKNLEIFSTVQHTTNFAPGNYTVPEYAYAASNIIIPQFHHAGIGTVISYNSFVTVETGTPHYTVQIDRSGIWLWWSTDWITSNQTYAQSNTQVVHNTYTTTIPGVYGSNYGQFQIHFPDSNIQNSIDTLTATVTAHTGYFTDNPYILTNTAFRTDKINSIVLNANYTAPDSVHLTLLKNDIDYYWTGTAWAISTGYAQSNVIADISTNIATFLTVGTGQNIKIRAYLHSGNSGSTTPEIISIIINHEFCAIDPTLNEVIVYGYLRDIMDAQEGATIQVKAAYTIGDLTIIDDDFKDVVTMTGGQFRAKLNIESVTPAYLIWQIENRIIKTTFINSATVKFSQLTILENSVS